MKRFLSTCQRFISKLNPSLILLSLGFSLGFSQLAQAAEFRSILPAKAITYDAPSAQSGKLFIMNQGYPVEVIVNLGDWVKVRDQIGGLSWVASKDLSDQRMVLVTENTDIKAEAAPSSTLVATVEAQVVLELVSSRIEQGWVKVKHQDGITGYIQSKSVWGLY